MKRTTAFAFVISCLATAGYAQQTAQYTQNETYRKAIELFDQKKYASAGEFFRQVYTDPLSTNNVIYDHSAQRQQAVNAEYYAAICALELNNKNAESELLSFIKNYPTHEKSKTAKFQIGRVYFKNGKYKEAQTWFKEVDELELNANDRIEYNFKTAYCYFVQKDYAKAKSGFAKVKDTHSAYSDDANYYYAHIAYLDKDYPTAQAHLNKIKDVPRYADLYQFYTAQILLIDGKYDEVISFIEPGISGKSPYKSQLNKIGGAAHFNEANFQQAEKSFDTYLADKAATADQTSQDTYQIGYTFFQNKEYDKAIAQLESLIDSDDEYGQYGMLTLGNAFLATNNKNNARTAYQRGAKLTYNEQVREDCLLNYAKLAYETNFSPQALTAAREFVSKYPRSQNIDEAKTLLSEILLSTKNYKEALESLESVAKRKENTDLLYQKVAYYRGVEVYNAGDFLYATQLFDKSLNNPIDGKLEMQALYWKAESMFELKKFPEAIDTYEDFLSYPGVAGLANYKYSYYNLGYAYFKQEDYAKAASSFNRYISTSGVDKAMAMDATLRLGDCSFVGRNYDQALSQYNKVIVAGASGSDYALFQKAMILGINNKLNDKIYALKSLEELYPKSPYVDDAMYETAYANFMLNQYAAANQGFASLIRRFPNSSYVPKAMLSTGLVYFNADDDTNALAAYKKLVTEFPNTPEAKEAVLAIKGIYVGKGNSTAFLDYAKNTPGAAVTMNTQDSISFEAAKNLYLKGKCDQSIPAFSNYIKTFNQGYFSFDAHYYRAECLVQSKRTDEALADYAYLATSATNPYSEQSAYNAAKIYMDRKDLANAGPYFSRLQELNGTAHYNYAIVGLLKVKNFENDVDSTIYYSNKLVGLDKVAADDLNAAHLYAANAYLAKGDTSTAVKSLNNVSAATKSVYAAEAKYLTALLQFKKGQYKQSQKTCFEVVEGLSNYDYWVAKSFILLADNYYAQNDLFQAKSTLQSIIDNYEGDDDIIALAKNKLTFFNKTK